MTKTKREQTEHMRAMIFPGFLQDTDGFDCSLIVTGAYNIDALCHDNLITLRIVFANEYNENGRTCEADTILVRLKGFREAISGVLS